MLLSRALLGWLSDLPWPVTKDIFAPKFTLDLTLGGTPSTQLGGKALKLRLKWEELGTGWIQRVPTGRHNWGTPGDHNKWHNLGAHKGANMWAPTRATPWGPHRGKIRGTPNGPILGVSRTTHTLI